MTQVTLSDQLGAKALIDQMRTKQLLVAEHLDLPARRAETVMRLREYYKTQNITVDDAMIEEGVRAFMGQRLTFQAPQLTRTQALLTNLYITREKWQHPAGIVAAVALCVALGTSVAVKKLDTNATASVQTAVQGAANRKIALTDRIEEVKRQMIVIGVRNSAASLPSVSRFIRTTSDDLDRATQLVQVPALGDVTKENRDDLSRRVSLQSHTLDEANKLLDTINQRADAALTILGANDRLAALVADKDYSAIKAKYAIVADTERTLRQTLAQPELDDARAAADKVPKFGILIDGAANAEAVFAQLRDIESQFKKMGLPADDMEQITAQVASVQVQLQRLELGQAKEALGDLENMLTFAATPLTINIVDRAGAKSAVQRAFFSNKAERASKESNALSWFAIAEAVDASGNVVPVSVTSVESRRHALAKQFGVRISKDTYESIKVDKKADGHVDNKKLGMKPANSLTVHYDRAFSDKPDMILEW